MGGAGALLRRVVACILTTWWTRALRVEVCSKRLNVAPRFAKDLFLQEVWQRPRLPVPHIVWSVGKTRFVVPPGLAESIVDESATRVGYRVDNPSWATLYPARRHEGEVSFASKREGECVAEWRVDVEPYDDFLSRFWVEWFTRLVLTTLIAALERSCADLDADGGPIERAFIKATVASFANSTVAARTHIDHRESSSATHLFKKFTPLVGAADALKLRFVASPLGRLVERVMRVEAVDLADWKVDKIVDAAGDAFDYSATRADLLRLGGSAPVVVFSFVDCPWCLAAVQLLRSYGLRDRDLDVIDLEPLGLRGKHLRAAIALDTGRTSMPAIYIGGVFVGGHTDAVPTNATGLLPLHRQGRLEPLLRDSGCLLLSS